MRPLRLAPLLLVALAVGVVAFVGLRALEGSGGPPLLLPWTAPAGLFVLAAAVLGAGWPVRRWNRGVRDRPLDPLRAARTLVLARASSITGAALAGGYAALVAVLAPTVEVEPRRERLLLALVAVLASAALTGAGLLVERWCRVPPDDSDEPPGAARDALG